MKLSIAKIHDYALYDNDGAIILIDEDANEPAVRVNCRAQFKRGQGHMAKCAKRDALAALIVRLVNEGAQP